MTEEQIIEAWAWVRKNNNSIPDAVLDFMKDSAIAALQNKGEWISVEERLPEFNKNVLALSKNGVIAISFVNSAGELDDYELEMSNGDYYTHWQPIPATKQTVTQ